MVAHISKVEISELDKIDAAISVYAEQMRRRMYEKHEEGCRGWGGASCGRKLAVEMNKDTVLVLKDIDIEKNLIDIGTRAMMLWWRAQNTPPEKG